MIQMDTGKSNKIFKGRNLFTDDEYLMLIEIANPCLKMCRLASKEKTSKKLVFSFF